mgnify:FL=1
MDNKTLSIVSYITLIGWLIAYFKGKDNADSLLKYHLRQGLGLFIVSLVFNAILSIVVIIIPALSFLGYIGLAVRLLIIIGIINASNEVQKPLPIIGKMFESKFDFIG